MSTAPKCPNCDRWFSTSGGLRQHFNACCSKNDADVDVDVDMEQQQHPLHSMNLLHRNNVVDQNNKRFCNHDDIDISNPYDDEILFDVPNFDNTLTVGSNISTDETSCYFDESSYDRRNNDDHHAALVMEPSTTLQIHLNELISNHKASLKLHNNIVELFKAYISSPSFDRHKKLTHRKQFMQRMEKTLHLKHLHPKFCNVKLHDKSAATVPVFDAKAMILDILNNPTCMTQSNFAEGYNVLTG